jgi:hypothetical protein
MHREMARGVLPLVNDEDQYKILQDYVENRIQVLHVFLEVQKSHEKILEIQGAIAELRLFQTLREQAVEGAK